MPPKPRTAKTPAELLRRRGPLSKLLNQAEHLNRLQSTVDSLLQPAARAHCRVASYREGNLLLILDSAHWATRLRYQENRLLRLLQEQEGFTAIQRILIKVRPVANAAGTVQPPRGLSQTAVDSLNSTAADVSDPGLRAALRRLAQHQREDSPSDQ